MNENYIKQETEQERIERLMREKQERINKRSIEKDIGATIGNAITNAVNIYNSERSFQKWTDQEKREFIKKNAKMIAEISLELKKEFEARLDNEENPL